MHGKLHSKSRPYGNWLVNGQCEGTKNTVMGKEIRERGGCKYCITRHRLIIVG